MVSYPAFVAECEGRDLAALAARSGVPVETVEWFASGGSGLRISDATAAKLARALGRHADELFASEPDVAWLRSTAPSWDVQAPDSLRVIGRL